MKKSKEPPVVRTLFGSFGSSKMAKIAALFPFPPPTSLKHEFYGLTSGFTRIIMKIINACYGLVSLHVNFHDNRTK